MRRSRPRPLGALLGAALLAATLGACACGGSSSRSPSAATLATGQGGFVGAELPGTIGAPNFTLTNQHGKPVTLSSLRGQPVVLTFAYAGCGPVCIVIEQQIRGALNELGRPVPVLLVSADPATDTPAAVANFLAQVSLTGRVQYLTGTPAQLRPIWRAYHVMPGTAGRAAFDKYASVLLIDRAGDERVLYSEEQLTPEALAHDLARLGG